MIYDTTTLKIMFKNYSNINQKICLEVNNNNLIRIKRGLYTDDLYIDGPVISNICYNPSYISFEYALSFYGLIPEYVSAYTCATYKKKNNKQYFIPGLTLDYKSIPNEVYPYGIDFFKNEKGLTYKMASKEKALCDQLYSMYPVRSIKDLKILLFENLRIYENEFMNLDFSFIIEIADLYHSNTLYTLKKYINEELIK